VFDLFFSLSLVCTGRGVGLLAQEWLAQRADRREVSVTVAGSPPT